MANKTDKNRTSPPPPTKPAKAPEVPAVVSPPQAPRTDTAQRAVEALKTSLDALREEVRGLGGTLSSAGVLAPIREELGRGIQQKLEGASRDAKVAFDQAAATLELSQRTRLQLVEGLVQDVRARLVDGDARLIALDERVNEARVASVVQSAVTAVADRVFRDEFKTQLDRLGEAFADADDQVGQLKAYVAQFGPGGLPVLKQHNEELERRSAALQLEVESLRARVVELEAARIRQQVEHGIDPALVDDRLRKLDVRDRELADRDSLQSENARLRTQIERQKTEIAEWTALDLGQQKARADEAELKRLREQARASHESLADAETARIRAEQRAATREREAEKLRRLLEEAATDRAAAAERQTRLEMLTDENHDLARQYEEQATILLQLQQLLRQTQIAQQQLERQVMNLQATAATAEVTWKRAYAEEKRTELDALKENLRQWAEREAEARSVIFRADTERLDAEAKALRQRKEELEKRLRDAELARDTHAATIRLHQQEMAALAASVDRQKAALDQEAEAHLNRLEAQLQADAEGIRNDAIAWAERERAVAKADADQLTNVANQLDENIQALQGHRAGVLAELAELGAQKGVLGAELESLRGQIHDLRIRAVPAEERVASLHRPLFENLPEVDAISEDAWLNTLEKDIQNAGFSFSPRLLRAFHTSLKIAHYAPLTVLAGISGTGKSELPRLYADLGGLPFLELAVQPSWDSPHDLFGFFNYTDGRLKAEPLSRLLQQLDAEGNPLRQSPVLVLLDEMNLARVEYYFAELLSKLEARRGVKRFADDTARDRASVWIDVGPGENPIPLYLDERILFAGTMNQDESTLTLSDKVLDRSCLLTFPAPSTLEMKAQPKIARRSHRLSYDCWQNWLVHDPPGDDEKSAELNRLNDVMRSLDRPFGHRLFRAIHAYLANYRGDPKHAWADQYAMKVLPRLRGLECGDRRVRTGLVALNALVPDELKEAFMAAQEREFFAWTGAADLYKATS